MKGQAFLLRVVETVGRANARRLLLVGAAVLALSQMAVLTLAAETHRVSQKGRAFLVKELTVSAGDLVQFFNDDEFIHQIYVEALNFDSPESWPGNSIDVRFDKAGTYEVRCHIHPKMLLAVTVK